MAKVVHDDATQGLDKDEMEYEIVYAVFKLLHKVFAVAQFTFHVSTSGGAYHVGLGLEEILYATHEESLMYQGRATRCLDKRKER